MAWEQDGILRCWWSPGGQVVTADLMHHEEPVMTEKEQVGKPPVGKPPFTNFASASG